MLFIAACWRLSFGMMEWGVALGVEELKQPFPIDFLLLSFKLFEKGWWRCQSRMFLHGNYYINTSDS
jgi:hypothetical protein